MRQARSKEEDARQEALALSARQDTLKAGKKLSATAVPTAVLGDSLNVAVTAQLKAEQKAKVQSTLAAGLAARAMAARRAARGKESEAFKHGAEADAARTEGRRLHSEAMRESEVGERLQVLLANARSAKAATMRCHKEGIKQGAVRLGGAHDRQWKLETLHSLVTYYAKGAKKK